MYLLKTIAHESVVVQRPIRFYLCESKEQKLIQLMIWVKKNHRRRKQVEITAAVLDAANRGDTSRKEALVPSAGAYGFDFADIMWRDVLVAQLSILQ